MKQTNEVQTVKLAEVAPWPGLNPRRSFSEEELQELANSIQEEGLLQPVSVSPAGEGAKKGVRFWLFAGERRWRASKLAKTKTIRVLVTEVNEKTAHRLAGLENLDRSDLTAIEEGLWLERELELSGLSQRKLADELKRSQSWIANRLRLLQLPKVGQNLLQDGLVSPATARDHLLRFLKLDEDIQKKLWPAISKKVRAASSKGEAVPDQKLREAVAQALHSTGATVLSNYVQVAGMGYVSMDEKDEKAFRKAHAGRCVQYFAHSSYGGREAWVTWEPKAWEKVAKEKKKAARELQVKRQGRSVEDLQAPGLPEDEVLDYEELEASWGYENVQRLDHYVGLPEELESGQIVFARKTERDFNPQTRDYDEREAVVPLYVGPDAKALQHKAEREEAEVKRKAVERKLGRDLKKELGAAAVLAGVVEAVVSISWDGAKIVQELLEALGVEVPEGWERDAKLAELELSKSQLEAVATALAVQAGRGDYRRGSYRRHQDVQDKAVRRRRAREANKLEALAAHRGIELPEEGASDA